MDWGTERDSSMSASAAFPRLHLYHTSRCNTGRHPPPPPLVLSGFEM